MLRKLQHFSVLFFIFALVFVLPKVSLVFGDESEAISKISQAEDSLKSAYLSVLEAERAGGDVFELVASLNTALEYYSEAEKALELGNYEKALFLADKVVETSNMVLEANISLIVVVRHFGDVRFRNLLFLSVGVVFFIILFGFYGWKLFKDYYLQRMLKLRPEVIADEP